MFCKYCGYKLADDAIFCSKCGKKLVTEIAQAVIPLETESSKKNENEETVEQNNITDDMEVETEGVPSNFKDEETDKDSIGSSSDENSSEISSLENVNVIPASDEKEYYDNYNDEKKGNFPKIIWVLVIVLIGMVVFSSIKAKNTELEVQQPKLSEERSIKQSEQEVQQPQLSEQELLKLKEMRERAKEGAALYPLLKEAVSLGVGSVFAQSVDIDINQQDKTGCTVLMKAAARHDLYIINLLYQSRIAVDLQDENGLTALMWSVIGTESDFFIARSLVFRFKANKNIRDNNGLTAYDIAFLYCEDPNKIDFLK